jgi:hypothetical protein
MNQHDTDPLEMPRRVIREALERQGTKTAEPGQFSPYLAAGLGPTKKRRTGMGEPPDTAVEIRES